jgi:hypothetical protein
LTGFFFILVVIGAIEEPVSCLDRLPLMLAGVVRKQKKTHIIDCVGCALFGHFPETEAYKGHLMAGGEFYSVLDHFEDC